MNYRTNSPTLQLHTWSGRGTPIFKHVSIAAFSAESLAKLVHRVLLLYLVVSSALER